MMRSLLVLVYISLLTRIDRLAAEAGHGFGSLPGSPHNISRDDRGLLKALLFATYSFNNQSNDAFLFRVCAIEKAQRQIIKGIRYIMEVQISRTICRKPDARKLKECDFQPEGQLHQTFSCHFEVWDVLWLHVMETTFFCLPSTEKSSVPLPGFRSADNPNNS
ncbi:cystatin-F-like [Lampris incognitus]|uniref:cystatin-F-like n=1 Tax=Lampris incognitus TaxID=2546036 RepID=UPI0024B49B2B|nr:cystatin-F-like [Lampris incognitus]